MSSDAPDAAGDPDGPSDPPGGRSAAPRGHAGAPDRQPGPAGHQDGPERRDGARRVTRGGDGWYRVWLPRAVVATIAVAAAWFGAIWVFSSTTGFLMILLIATFLSFAMLPGVEGLVRRGWRRGAAAGFVMAIGAVVVVAFVGAMTTVVVGQVANLVGEMPRYLDTAAPWVRDNLGIPLDTSSLTAQLSGDQQNLQNLASNALGGVLGVASTFVGAIFQALTISLFVFFMLADLPRLRATIYRRFPPEQQEYIDTIVTITIDKVGGWTYSRGVLALASAGFHFMVFMVLGLPYALAMAMWVGIVSQFVPTVGTYVAGVLPVIIALLENPIDALWVVAAIVVYQSVENYLLAPKVTANTMNLHPAVAFGSAIVGASLLGGIGALLALPVAATVTAVVQTYADHYDVISSGTIAGAEDYEQRMQARTEAKLTRRASRSRRRATDDDRAVTRT